MGEQFIGDTMEKKLDYGTPKKKSFTEKLRGAAAKVSSWQEQNRKNYLERVKRDTERAREETKLYKEKAKLSKYKSRSQQYQPQGAFNPFGSGDLFGRTYNEPKPTKKRKKSKRKRR